MGDQQTWNGVFHFNPEDRIYETHFPSNPVVPGSVIIHAFMSAAEKVGYNEKPYRIENFRFKRFISPGEYAWEMESSNGGLSCKILENNNTVVTGNLKYL
ncbi:MAG: hypothetical protein K9L30_06515 [Desulfobacterales bacterium]|nr:hypothetical protein [Desulfobacterales bacterium]